MYSFWGHIVWSSHCKENEQMRSYHPRKRRRNPHCTEMWLSWRMRVSRNSSLEKSGTRLWKEIMPSKAYSHLEPKIQPHEHLMTAEHCWKHLLYFRTLKKAFLPPEPPLRLPWAEPPWNNSSLVHSAAQEAVRYTSWVYSATTRSQDSTPLTSAAIPALAAQQPSLRWWGAPAKSLGGASDKPDTGQVQLSARTKRVLPNF